jgi:hypothetical protein
MGSTHRNPSTKNGCKESQPRLPRVQICRVATATTTTTERNGHHHYLAAPQALCRHRKTPSLKVNHHHSGAPSGVESSAASPTLRNQAARVTAQGLGICLNDLEGHGGRGWVVSVGSGGGGSGTNEISQVRWIEAETKEMARGGETKKLQCKKKTGSGEVS